MRCQFVKQGRKEKYTELFLFRNYRRIHGDSERKMSKRVRISTAQREILLAFMLEHEKFGRNQIAGPNAIQIKKVLLKRLTHQLNSPRFVVKKTPDKWLKSWQDWKSDIRAKQLRIKRYNKLKLKEDDELQLPCPLTKLEEKLLLFINGSVEHLNASGLEVSRERKVSLAQREAMFAFMDKHEELAFSIISGPDREQIKKEYLSELAQKLNALGPARKSPEKWFKCWLEWKSDVIAKVRKIKSHNKGTANMDDEPPFPLSGLEEELYRFLDVDSMVSEDEDIDEGVVHRDKRVTPAQRETMFAFMQAHPNFGKGQITGPNAAKIKTVMLKRLANQLNTLGPVTKTPDKWLKSWQDWKSDTKAKWYKICHFKLTEAIMHDYVRSPCPLTPLEEKLVTFFGFGQIKDTDEHIQTWQDTKTTLKKQPKNKSERTELPDLQPQIQKNISVSETPVPGPSNSQEFGLIIEDIYQTGSPIKLEAADSSDSNDPLNFEEKYLQPDPHTAEPENEPEIEQPTRTASTSSRRRRFRRVVRRPLTQARLDTINHLTVNEVKKALIEKNAIKKQFYADYMVEIRKQTQALVTIANKLSNR